MCIRDSHAHEALRKVLKTMSTNLVEAASPTISLIGVCVTEEAMVSSPEVSHAIRTALEALAVHLAGSGA